MATKLKNLTRAWYMKLLAYIIIALTAAGVLLYVGNRGNYNFFGNLGVVSYDVSNQVYHYFNEWGSQVVTIASVNPEELDINNKKYWNFKENESDFAAQTGQEQAEIINSSTEHTDNAEKETEDVVNGQIENGTVENTTETDLGEMPEDTTSTVVENLEEVTEVDEGESTTVYLKTQILNPNIEEIVKEELRNFYYVWWNEGGYVHLTIKHDGDGNLYYQSVDDVPQDKKINLSYTNFLKEHPIIEKEVITAVLQRWLYEYNMAKGNLDYAVKEEGLIFDIVKADSKELKEKYTSLPIYMRIENNYVTNSSSSRLIGMTMHGNFDNYYMENKICYVGMSNEYYEEKQAEWNGNAALGNSLIRAGIIGTTVIIISFLYLALVTGRKPEEESVFLYKIDVICSELQWIIGFCCGFGVILLLLEVLFYREVILNMYHYTTVAVIVVMGMIVLSLLLSQIRLLKAKKWLNSFICFRLLKKCFKMIKRAFKSVTTTWKRGKLSNRAMTFAIVLPIVCATWIGVPFVIGFLIYMLQKHMEDFIEICEGAERIREGQLNYQIEIRNKDGELEKLADDINEISQGLEKAVSSELRSERLKAELISNVSHDLKTPLTSIVTYVDLLKQEEINNDVAKDYIEVIDRKAKRLTVLTNDLFEAAKASSGDMPVNIETVDLNALVRQALGEFDEKLEKADLNIRLTLPEGASYVKADGRLSWRVIDNLLNNVVKYAQTGSRVYIEVKDLGNTFGFVIKNISAYELNIPSDELMERFKRGDESRNSEGSGLGLSIANSLIDLQRGSFRISIDGDLFKAEFELPKSN